MYFNKSFLIKTEKPEELALHAREMLRKEFLSADIGITGCNFAIAESGSISLVTNEGNARLTTALPKTQITVMGMERIVPTFEEFEVLVSLLTRSAVGQRLTSYVTALTGPRLPGEVDGPEEFHLVIVDNGRSAILGTEFQSVLQCIRCAACVNVCPVYRHIGGHSYGSIYSGPIGAVLSLCLEAMKITKSFHMLQLYAQPVRMPVRSKFRCMSYYTSTVSELSKRRESTYFRKAGDESIWLGSRFFFSIYSGR